MSAASHQIHRPSQPAHLLGAHVQEHEAFPSWREAGLQQEGELGVPVGDMLGLARQRPEHAPERAQGLVDGASLGATLALDLASVQSLTGGRGGERPSSVHHDSIIEATETQSRSSKPSLGIQKFVSVDGQVGQGETVKGETVKGGDRQRGAHTHRASPPGEVDHVERASQACSARMLPDDGEPEDAVAARAVLIHGGALRRPDGGVTGPGVSEVGVAEGS